VIFINGSFVLLAVNPLRRDAWIPDTDTAKGHHPRDKDTELAGKERSSVVGLTPNLNTSLIIARVIHPLGSIPNLNGM